ncbi:hypothetical protein K438DRAFT_442432 [Mycena galopus ATCC 62051]|nr:hypothetical protein K438DRAFT_442432 [Mycena galopus ATCC 62051]
MQFLFQGVANARKGFKAGVQAARSDIASIRQYGNAVFLAVCTGASGRCRHIRHCLQRADDRRACKPRRRDLVHDCDGLTWYARIVRSTWMLRALDFVLKVQTQISKAHNQELNAARQA